MKKTPSFLLPALAAVFALASCQDGTSGVSDPGTSGAPSIAARGYTQVLLPGSEDSCNAAILILDSADTSASLSVGDVELPARGDSVYYLPLPDLDDFCGASAQIEIKTRGGVYHDTVRIHGQACDDSASHASPGASDSSIVFFFQDTGRTTPDSAGRHLASTGSAVWGAEGDSFYLRATSENVVSFGNLIPDGTPEGAIEIRFRPGSDFAGATARTIFGNDGARLHIGWAAGQLFFQKNHDNLHRYIASDTGLLLDTNWHTIKATWGPLGMTLSLDGELVAWSNDISVYHAALSQTNTLRIGGKSYCCMEPERITNAIDASGDYRLVRIRFRQPKVWNDGAPHACVERSGRPIPSCGITVPEYVVFPIW